MAKVRRRQAGFPDDAIGLVSRQYAISQISSLDSRLWAFERKREVAAVMGGNWLEFFDRSFGPRNTAMAAGKSAVAAE